MKRPAFQFYPGDWLRDPGLRACSLAARGLWMDMMCCMHQGSPYGYLTMAPREGAKDVAMDILRPIHPHVLARIVGSTEQEVSELLGELEDSGVFSRNDAGVIYSRRMLRDEELREIRAAGGCKSLENPNVPRPKVKREDCTEDTFELSTAKSFGGAPSSSSSSSSSNLSLSSEPPGSDHIALRQALDTVWNYYIEQTGRNPKLYRFTNVRQRKGLLRLRECLTAAGGDVARAVELMKCAVDGLCRSDWHMGRDAKSAGKAYCEWDRHLFDTYERMERWWNDAR